jgi:hypothetical protein
MLSPGAKPTTNSLEKTLMFTLYVDDKVKSEHLDYQQAWKQFNRQRSYNNNAKIYFDGYLCADSGVDDRFNQKPEDYCNGP